MPDALPNGRPRERVALVLAGGGARGAYEAGALAVLLPALAARGQSPDVIVGTSIGALNGAFLAARAAEPPAIVCGEAVEMWRGLRWGDALRPLVSTAELGRVLSAGAMLAGLPSARVPGLLDPSPLRRTLSRLVSFKEIARNVEGGALAAAAVVATSYATTRSVVFHHGGPEIGADPVRSIDYAATRLAPEHVLASAAIPAAFPAVEIKKPRAACGWYGDGGVRLNAPLAPALALGADRVVVIGLNSSVTSARPPRRPDATDGVAQLLQVVLSDQLAEDVATLATVNEVLASTQTGEAKGAAAHRRRKIPYIFVAPCDRLEIGRLAHRMYTRHYARIDKLVRNPSLALLGRIVSAQRSAVHGDLLSYLLLAPEFIDELIALGERDARRWLSERHDAELWQLGPLPADTGSSAPKRPKRRSASARAAKG
ncbi:MAG TPA: patatin-like phospholipase family protein [Solirubrobacteraceae bacterium]|nr:patatin-like phospholipase family protein [Solirubrobacteraceae bacterium]